MTDDVKTDDQPSDAHEVALELLKQLIALASGVLALSATFIEKLSPATKTGLVVLGAAWLALLVSVFGGLQGMSAVVKSRLDPDHDWSTGKGQFYARLAKYGFLLGILLFALFAFLSLLRISGDSIWH